MPSVLVLGVSNDGDISMAFASNFLKFQGDLQRVPNVRAAFDVVSTLQEALKKFKTSPEYEYLVAIDTNHGIDNTFLTQYDPAKDFVVGIYPERVIDWKRVADKIATSPEDPQLTGITYNIDPEKCTPNGRYLVVKTAGLRIIKITRAVVDKIDQTYDTSDSRLCELWGGDIYASLHDKTSSQVTVSYGPGCIAWRSQLR